MRTSARSGFTLVEVMIVVAIIALLAAIAIPNVLRGRTSANETAAVGNIKALLSSMEMYRSVSNAYPTTAQWVVNGVMYPAGQPGFGPPSFNAGSPVTVQGFTYTYAGTANTYSWLVVPVTAGTTGTRSFYADQTGIVRHCTMGAPTAPNGPTWATLDSPPTAACN